MSFALFYISLFLLLCFFGLKYYEHKSGKKSYISSFGNETDKLVSKFWLMVKKSYAQLSVGNTIKFFSNIWILFRSILWRLKKRFDSTQPRFFWQQNQFDHKGKGKSSFFWRNISEYKNGLKDR